MVIMEKAMKVTAKIEDCEITVSDDGAVEPTTSRWSDQHVRIKELIVVAQAACIELHKQKVADA
jgi:hypothetical protein